MVNVCLKEVNQQKRENEPRSKIELTQKKGIDLGNSFAQNLPLDCLEGVKELVDPGRSVPSINISKETVERKYYPVMDMFHGINHSPTYYNFELHCKKILIPFNLVYDKKVKIDYVLNLKKLGIEIIIDSGAAAYHIDAEKKRKKEKQVGYPDGYLEEYLDFLEKVKPSFAFALDTCFESKEFRTIPKFIDNLIRQEETINRAKERGIKTPIYMVVQGWNRASYFYSARFTQAMMNKHNLTRYGIGSICQAPPVVVREVLTWIEEVLDLSQSHAFGQTQRTAIILKEFNVGSLDSANATSNAGRISYCDPLGTWFYSKNSNQGSRKHDLIDGIAITREKYNYMFLLGVESLDLSCYNEIPHWWVHPVENYAMS